MTAAGESLSFLQTPVEHTKFSVAPESSDAKELEEETEIDVFHFTAILPYLLSQLFCSQPAEPFSALPESPLLSSPGIPLFVLYHAWKNFF